MAGFLYKRGEISTGEWLLANWRLWLLLALAGLCLFAAIQTRAVFADNKPADDASDNVLTFRDVPGITQEEIAAIDKVLAKKDFFTYGVSQSNECFYRPDGSMDGYAVLLADWLSKFFGKPFRAKMYTWEELAAGLTKGSIDFSGGYTPILDGRSEGYIMTVPISWRQIESVIRVDSPPPEKIAKQRRLRVAFLHGAMSKAMALPHLEKQYGAIRAVDVNGVNAATKALLKGDIDMFVADNTFASIFLNNKSFTVNSLSPSLYRGIPIVSPDPTMVPLIAAINKYIGNGGNHHLDSLFHKGIIAWQRMNFIAKLNKEERAWYEEHIHSGQPIAVGDQTMDYPIMFYNPGQNRWSGIVPDILAQITEVTGLSFKPVDIGSGNLSIHDKLRDGAVPMIAWSIYGAEPKSQFLVADKPYLTDRYVLVSLNERENLGSIWITRPRIGILQGSSSVFQDSSNAVKLRQWFPGYTGIKEFPTQEAAFAALEKGDIDFFMTSQIGFLYITNYLQQSKFKINMIFDDSYQIGFAFSGSEKALRGIINKSQAFADTSDIVSRWEHRIFDYQGKIARTRNTLLLSMITAIVLALLALFSILRHSEKKRLETLVAERTRALDEQIEATAVASAAKSSFLAGMSHELRTPLTTIIGLSELMLNGEKDDKEENGFPKKIYRAGRNMLMLINQLLDISKIEAGKFELIPVEYETPSRLSDAISMNLTRKGDKDIRFDFEIDDSFPNRLYGDDLRVSQIVNNILSNAFKYTEKGVVMWRVDWERQDQTIWLTHTFRDTGIGIRPEDMPKLFGDYNQLDTRANRHIQGTGLGLAVTKRLVEMMGGTIEVTSEYGAGSVFTVRIPQGFVADEPIGKAVAEALRNFRYIEDRFGLHASLERIQLPDVRVLVVDDVVTNLDVAKGMLKPYGMKVDTLTSGQRALELVQAEKPRYDLIFMDHMMPGMDGIETLERIRALGGDYAANVPVIALTANAIVGNDKMFIDKGFQDFVPKPIEIKELDNIIKKWLGEKALAWRSWPGWQPGSADLEQALTRFGGDEREFVNVLYSYAKHTIGLLRQLAEVSEAGLAHYAIKVHGLKGSSYSIGANGIGDQAKELELAAKAGDFALVTAKNAAFIATTEKLVAELYDLMDGVVNAGKAEKEAPERALLERLRLACGQYDMDEIDQVMEELESFRYQSGQELVIWLREEVEKMNLESIDGRLAEYLGEEKGEGSQAAE